MTDDSTTAGCLKCGCDMESGYTNAEGLMGGSHEPGVPQLTFIVPGTPTSRNPARALMQGLRGESDSRVLQISGSRCVECGYLELYAT